MIIIKEANEKNIWTKSFLSFLRRRHHNNIIVFFVCTHTPDLPAIILASSCVHMASRTYKKIFLQWINPWGKRGVDPLQELRGRSNEQFDPVEDQEGSIQCKGQIRHMTVYSFFPPLYCFFQGPPNSCFTFIPPY